MKPPPFQYHDPKTVAEAVGLLGRLENAKLLAGGQSLMPMLNMRFVLPDHVIDINRVEGLAGIKETGGVLEVGAMTRQRDIEYSDLVKAKCPLLHQAIMHIGHRQTRNRGTIGGSLCHLDPAAELVSVCAAHDATVVVEGPNGRREIAFADFPVAFMTPSIELNEIVTAVRLPLWAPGHKAAFVEFSRRHGDFAIVSAAALLEINGGKISRASLTIGGVAVAPHRARDVEQAIAGQAPSQRSVPQGLRKLPLDRSDRGHPRFAVLPPASRRGPLAPRAGEGGGPRRQRAVEQGALMRRRDALTLLGGAAARRAAAGCARAQRKPPTLGFLGPASASAMSAWTAAFVQRLRELGYVEGRTIAIEYRWGDGRSDRFAEFAAEFVRLKVDVIVTTGTRGPRH